MPPSYLFIYSLDFAVVLSIKIILIPLFKKASSRILFCKIAELNLIDENISLEGKKVILVPFFFVLPICFSGFVELPFLKLTAYSFPSLKSKRRQDECPVRSSTYGEHCVFPGISQCGAYLSAKDGSISKQSMFFGMILNFSARHGNMVQWPSNSRI